MNPSRNLRAGIFLPSFHPADEDPACIGDDRAATQKAIDTHVASEAAKNRAAE